MILSFVFLLSSVGIEQEILIFRIHICVVALHSGRLGGVGIAEVVAVGAVAAAVLVGRDVELAHLGAAHGAAGLCAAVAAALLSLAAGRPRLCCRSRGEVSSGQPGAPREGEQKKKQPKSFATESSGGGPSGRRNP